MATVEQQTLIRAGLDASSYKAGAADIVQANTTISASGEQVVQSQVKTTRSLTDGGAAFERYRRQADQVYAATQKYEQVQQTVARALEAGRASQTEANTVLAAYAARVDAARVAADRYNALNSQITTSTTRASGAMRQFGIQSIDVFTQLQSGAPVMTTFIQQGGQILQVAANQTGVLGALKAAFAALVSPIGLVVTGVVAATAAVVGFAAAGESTERRLLSIQTALRATRDDWKDMGQTAAAASKAVSQGTAISGSDATAAVKELAGANFSGTQSDLESLIRTAGDLAAVLGKTVPNAAKDLARALDEPGKYAQDLANQHFPGMTAALAESIRRMEEMGDASSATARVLDVLKSAVDGAREESLTPLQQALEGIAVGFANIGSAATNALNTVLGSLKSMAAEAAKTREQMSAQGGVLMPWSNKITGNVPSEAIPGKGISTDIQNQISEYLSNSGSGVRTGTDQYTVPTVQSLLGSRYRSVQSTISSAIGDVNSSTSGQIEGYQRKIDGYNQSLKTLSSIGVTAGDSVDFLNKAIAENQQKISDAQKKLEGHTKAANDNRSAIEKTTDKTTAQIAAQNQLAEAYKAGDTQVTKVTAALKAQQDAISGGLTPGTLKYAVAVERSTAANIALAEATGRANMEKSISDTNRATEAQLAIAAAYDGTEESLTHAQNAQTAMAAALKNSLTPGTDEYTDAVSRMTAGLDASSAATEQLRQKQQSWNALTSTFTNAFDRLGDSLVDAFVNGSSKAVDFGNIFKALVSSIVTDIAKLAIISPTLNSLFGTNNATLWSALGTVGSAATGSSTTGTSSSSGGLLSGVSNAGTVISTGNTLTGGWLLDSLGITGQNGLTGTLSNWLGIGGSSGEGGGIISSIKSLFQPSGFFGSNGSVAGFLNSGLFGTSLTEASLASTNAAIGSLGSGTASLSGGALNTSLFGPATADALASNTVSATGLFGGSSLGTIATGVGAGFGAGSLVGGLVSNAAGKANNIGGTVGAGIGSVGGGAIAGSVFGPVGTIVGGLLGGIIGGAGGGLIGPPKKNPYSHTEVGLTDEGTLEVGKSYNQLLDSNRQDVIDYVDSVNSFLEQANLTIDAAATSSDIFGNYGKGNQNNPWMKGENVSDIFGGLRFQSDDPTLNKLVSGQSWNTDDITKLVNQYKEAQAAINDFLSNTSTPLIDAMKDQGAVTGTLQDTINSLNTTYNDAIDKAKMYQDTQYASDEQLASLAKAETELQAARDKGIKTAQEAAYAQLAANINSYDLRIDYARATRSGDTQTLKDIALRQFDVNAQTERDSTTAKLVETFGTAFKSTKDYADQMAALEVALGEERLNTAKQYDDQIVANAKAAADQAAAIDAQRLSAFQTSESYSVRYWNANANITGSLDDAKNAALFSQQVSADQERTALISKYKAIFGDAYAQSYEYWIESLRLEEALGEERLEIQKTYNDKIAAQEDSAKSAAASAISSITDYVKKFQIGTDSPLSAQAQYDLASQQFNAVQGAAVAGDANSIQQFTTYADSLATAARSLYGSGQGYVDAVQRILDAAGQIGQIQPETLTKSFMAQQIQTQTQTLVNAIQSLQGEVTALRRQVQTNSQTTLRAA